MGELSERIAFTGAVVGLSLGFAIGANLAHELYRDLREGGSVACAHAPMLDNLEAPYRASLRAWPLGVSCTWADLHGDVTVDPGWGNTIQGGAAVALLLTGGIAARAASRAAAEASRGVDNGPSETLGRALPDP